MAGKKRGEEKTELMVKEGLTPEPGQLLENAPEVRPLFDRTDFEDKLEALQKERDEKIAQFVAQGDSEFNSISQDPVVEEEPTEKPKVEVQPDSGEPHNEQANNEPSEKTEPLKFKDLSEAEAEIQKIEERRKNHEKKMYEATREAAESKKAAEEATRNLKFVLDTIQSGGHPPRNVEAVQQPEPKQSSILDLPPEEIEVLWDTKPLEVLAAIEKRSEEKAVKRAIEEIEGRVRAGTERQAANALKNSMEAANQYFESAYQSMKPMEELLGTIGTQMLATPEGLQSLIRDPKAYVDTLVSKANTFKALFVGDSGKPAGGNGNGTPPPNQSKADEEAVRGEKREKLVAAPVVKPSSAPAPLGEKEETPETPEEYFRNVSKYKNQVFTGRQSL